MSNVTGLCDQVLQKISEAGELYYRLILVVGPADSRKTKTLQQVSALTSAPTLTLISSSLAECWI